jgi:hypothetical protein
VCVCSARQFQQCTPSFSIMKIKTLLKMYSNYASPFRFFFNSDLHTSFSNFLSAVSTGELDFGVGVARPNDLVLR